MGFFSNLLDKTKKSFDKALNKKVDKEIDKAVDQAVNGKQTAQTTSVEQAPVSEPVQPVEAPSVNAGVNVSGPSINISRGGSSSASEGPSAEEIRAMAELVNATNNASANTKVDMAQANEIMNYFIFGKDMEVIGVKDDAPDWVKQAYQNGAFKE